MATWACASQLTEPGNLPPAALSNSTLRQFVHVTIGGSRLRLRLSNIYGTSPVEIQSVHVALASMPGPAGAGGIDTGTDHGLTFRGVSGITIPPGEEVTSDPCDFALPALTNLAVSIYFGNISATSINGHPGSRTTSFIQPGNCVSAARLPAARTAAHWYVIGGVDVFTKGAGGALVTLGDSITDGRGSTTDGNDRWPDDLARRLAANPSTAAVSVINMGIGGNGLFGGLGPAALVRFDHDVIRQNGARWLIMFEGVNDIGGDVRGTVAPRLIAAYQKMAAEAHAHHLLAYGATITPFGGNRYFTIRHEAARQEVNTWMRTNNIYDGVIDFDAVVRNPESGTNLLFKYDCGDGLHLNPRGYEAMANAVDLRLFAR